MIKEIKNYGQKTAFASFLPGIAGIKGTPIWCYYVNRGQGVVSFGVDNKDRAIMEFYPAHMAYQNVKRTGFRTFIRRNGVFFEPFLNEDIEHRMEIDKNVLNIVEDNKEQKIMTKVSYFVLPEEKVGALVRRVEITNTGNDAELEVLDGMPNVIPYGVGQDSMKNMTQTAKAWMQVEDHKDKKPFYRVRASMDDSSQVTTIEAGNFALGVNENSELLEVVVDADAIFGYDLSLGIPRIFSKDGLAGVENQKENISNLLPTCFFKRKKLVKANESICFYEVIGQVSEKSLVDEFAAKLTSIDYFENKLVRAKELTEDLTKGIATTTANEVFDEYVKYTYMDNILRGGYPIKLTKDKLFYIYSRKHGDLERDYNYFSMLPEFYSQGNGNFRDVNQNRRCDVFFNPFVEKENIKTFYNLIQMDGYNPLAIEKMTYIHPEFEKPFTPGELIKKVSENDFERIMEEATPSLNAAFGEGYWSDHWTYNLDLIEEYIKIYPEKEKVLLTEEDYFYFKSPAVVNKRAKRYEKTSQGIRQYHALTIDNEIKDKTVKVNGEDYKGSLLEKLILISAIKFATLDPYGMGVEMEGGKPGWYDALNGLPGIFGSSMAETYELMRNIKYTIKVLKKYKLNVKLYVELAELLEKLAGVLECDGIMLWNKANDIKEEYREKIYKGISGEKLEMSNEKLILILEGFADKISEGIDRARRIAGDVVPTYFSFKVTDFEEKEDGIYPKEFEAVRMPDFLEGPVRFLKLPMSLEEKQLQYKKVKESDLYDKALSMYKVNASLENASYEIGRCKAFTPGWLENESIWLHMEYKYLLELIKAGLYEDFFKDFKNAVIPFLNEDVYGRSVLENSSFIVSSKNPNDKIHGKGFVARLSGSTIEFISMWKEMFFGNQIFEGCNEEELEFKLLPAIPEYLIPDTKKIETTLMSDVIVEYELSEIKDYIPGSYEIVSYDVYYKDGLSCVINSKLLKGQVACDIRNGLVSRIKCKIK